MVSFLSGEFFEPATCTEQENGENGETYVEMCGRMSSISA